MTKSTWKCKKAWRVHEIDLCFNPDTGEWDEYGTSVLPGAYRNAYEAMQMCEKLGTTTHNSGTAVTIRRPNYMR